MAWPWDPPSSGRRSSSHHQSSSNRAYSTHSPSRSSYSRSYSYSSKRARPRSGYIQRLIRQIKHYARELFGYAKRHPVKLFMLVIMPLITGGALAGVLKRMGIRLPHGLARMMGGMEKGGGGGSWERRSGRGGIGEMLGGGEGLGQIMRIAQMFI